MTPTPSADLSVVLLLARDADTTAAFYRDLLGVPLAGEEHDGRHRHYAARLGPLYFTVQPAADLSAPPPPQGYDSLQLGFTVEDLDAFLARAAGQGVTPLHPPRPFEYTRYVTLLDPDGRHVRVMTPWHRPG
jgi:predicted enzyme related to lactoylglutathione lyase